MALKTLAAAACMTVATATTGLAATFNEIGDAGDLLATAQTLADGTMQISGSIASDQDLFGFTWSGGALTISTTASFDSQLFLFDEVGTIVGANDDGGAGNDSELTGQLAGGLYYAGISGFNSDPLNAAGADIENAVESGGNSTFQPGVCNTILSDCILAGWSGGSANGTYEINFSSSVNSADSPSPVPLPAGGVLLLSGLGGIAAFQRRKKRAA